MARILITGGAGFIGSNLAHVLCKKNDVVVLDDFSTGRRENLEGADIELVVGSVCDLNAVRRACQGVDFVLHQAALPSVPRSVTDPLATNAANVTGTLNVLIAARDAGVKRIVYASSSAVYGEQKARRKSERLSPNPISPYAASKLAGELYCRVFFQTYGLETVCLRYFNVFGPRQNPTGEYAAVVPRFISALLRGVPPVIYGDGRQSRDFTYVDNVVQANILAMKAKGAAGKVFNIACGKAYSVLTLLHTLEKIIGKKSTPKFLPPRQGDIRHSLADIELARRVLGYRPTVGFEEGLRKTVAWFEARDV
ncbi:MAG: SDR family oxidoreductase [Candidatus Micrarchaeia archaeon]